MNPFYAFFLGLVAVIPVVIILRRLYVLDRVEKEPLQLLILLLFGGMVAVAPAILFESLGEKLLDEITLGDFDYVFLDCFLVVALAEEGLKLLALWLIARKNPNFDHYYDGVVYAVFVSLGFAVVENIIYVYNYGIGTGLLRAVTAVPFHACCGMYMGFYISRYQSYRLQGKTSESHREMRRAFLVPWIIHGIYDFSLASGLISSTFVLLAVCFFFFRRTYRKTKALSEGDTSFENLKL